MRKYLQHLKLFLSAILIINALSSAAQKQFTHTATKANNYCNANCTLLDIPELNNNPSAIIFAAPIMENGLNLNPHPIGVYYFKNRWSIFNLDQRPISEGAMFNVEYVAKPDSTHYQYLITRENLQKDGSAVIDHLPINNPNIQLRFIPCWVPEFHVATVNRDEASIQFNNETGKWYISNINKKPLFERVGYNIIISSDRSSASYKAVQVNELNIVPITNLSTKPCKCPASLPPNGTAGGDLSGAYPNPTVHKLSGRPLSNTAPVTGQILKWNGTEWAASNESGTNFTAAGGIQLSGSTLTALFGTPMWNANKILGRDIVTTAPTVGQVLKFGGGSWVPADDNVGTGGTNNPESWKINGANISNMNNGNVGIGNNNPAYQLDINNRMRIRSGGNNSISAGLWLNNNANTEAAFIGMEDDTHVGLFGNSSGWKFSMNTQTGALKINGTEGTSGQVLTSNGAGSPPIWKQPQSIAGTEIKTYYKYTGNYQGVMEATGLETETKIPSISGLNITVTVPSTLVISANCYVRANCPVIGSCGLSMEFYYKVNNNASSPFSFAGTQYFTATISNHFYDVAPGTYTLDFFSRKRLYSPELNYSVAGGYVTVMVLPK